MWKIWTSRKALVFILHRFVHCNLLTHDKHWHICLQSLWIYIFSHSRNQIIEIASWKFWIIYCILKWYVVTEMKINCYPTPTFQLQLWSDRYVYMLMFRGAGCIFIEMLQGSPAFPGVADVFEQLLKIWAVSLFVRMY